MTSRRASGTALLESGNQEGMANINDAEQAIIDRVVDQAPEASPLALLYLAEALAWLKQADQAHGGSAPPKA